MNNELVITAAAAVTPFGLGVDAFANGMVSLALNFEPLAGAYAPGSAVATVPAYDARSLLATRSISNFDRLTLHVCVAVDQLKQQLGMADLEQRREALADERISFVLGSSGPLQSILGFDLQTIEEPRYVQASIYPNVVFNVPASYAAIRHGIRGSCITLTDGEASSLQAFGIAAAQLEAGRIDLALVGGAEEATPAYALYQAAQAAKGGDLCPPLSEGSVVFALERAERARAAGREPIATLHGCAQVFSPRDASAGLAACIAKLERRLGPLRDRVGVVCSEGRIDLEALGLGHCRPLGLGERLGHVGAMYGAYATLNALVRDDIPGGELILVLQADADGACAAALLQKRGGLAG